MLQIPSSVLSLVSFSSKCLVGLLGGFSINAHVAFTILSIPKNIFHSTQTTKIVLVPTKCVLSNGTVAFPFIAVMAYATVVFTSLFWILRAKGFSSRHPGSIPNGSTKSDLYSVGEQPPSPPSESGSGCSADKTPRRRQWIWLLWLIAVLLTLSGGVGAYFYLTVYDSRDSLMALPSFSRHGLSLIEQCFFDGRSAVASCISTIKIYISLQGRRYSKIFLVALAAHSIFLLIVSALRRFHHYSKTFVWYKIVQLTVGSLALMMSGVACSSQLSWILWLGYYVDSHAGGAYTVPEINWMVLRLSSYLSSLATSYFLEVSTIIGITLVHISIVCVLLVRSIVTFGARILAHVRLHPQDLRNFLGCSICSIALFAFVGLIAFPLQPSLGIHPNPQVVLWQCFSGKRPWDHTRILYWLMVKHYQEWKSEVLEDFHELTSGLPNTLRAGFNSWWEIWSSLHLMHKLLIVAPAVIFYGYFYVIPAARRIPLLIKKWRRR
ncbi:hypothetical protein FB451DRAFT_84699 [Mycena latifolia]|nr:hypothetical protein FB451DRAFT_84699 [Mycena latifolia]